MLNSFGIQDVGISFALITLEKFSEWTVGKEELYILQTQHRIYADLAESMRRLKGFVYAVNYDNLLAVINNVDPVEFMRMVNNISGKYGIKFVVTFGYGANAKEALEDISNHYCNNSFCIISTQEVCCLHFDVDSYLSDTKNIQEANENVIKYQSLLRQKFPEFVGFNISGDNVLFFGVGVDSDDVLGRFISMNNHRMKLGIGISPYPSDAATNSAIALEHIRHSREEYGPNLRIEQRCHVHSY